MNLLCGDCLEHMRAMPAGCVDAVVTDPPYFLPATHYNTKDGWSKSLSELSILEHFFGDVFREVDRILKDDGFVYVFCDGQSYPIFFVQAYPYFKKVRPLIWDKISAYMGYSWRHQHEIILFGQRIKAPAVKTGDGDVLKFRSVGIKKREHLAQKPIDLLEKLIAKTTPEGGTVLDPFMGSGSTGVACKNLGYDFIGIDLDPKYFEIAKKRIGEPVQLRLGK